jgi:hypothetical protein
MVSAVFILKPPSTLNCNERGTIILGRLIFQFQGIFLIVLLEMAILTKKKLKQLDNMPKISLTPAVLSHPPGRQPCHPARAHSRPHNPPGGRHPDR